MPRTYGTTNVMPYATAPPVGAVGDEYYNTTTKQLFLSDGTAWNPIAGSGGGGGAPYAPVQTTPPPASSPTISPPVGLLWVDTGTTSSGTNLIFYQTLTAPLVSAPATVTHNLGTIYIQAQLWDVVTGLLVGAQIKIIDANNIQISVTQNMPNNVNVVVMGQPGPGLPVNPPDYATKLYVDQRTPNLPPPVISGTTVQSYTDVLGDVWVALNGVNAGAWRRARDVLHARYYRVAGFTSLANAWSSLSMDTLHFDDYGMYSAGTGLFTPPVTGVYRLTFQCGATCTATAQWVQPGIWTGNVVNVVADVVGHASTAKGCSMNVTTIRRITTLTDTYVARFASSVALAGLTGADTTFFEMDYLGTG
jgi:hypothetical protein